MTGEEKHERCRFGSLTPAFVVPLKGPESPTVTPLCSWRPGTCPPALDRVWGGAVEPDRDCAVCPVFAEVRPVAWQAYGGFTGQPDTGGRRE